MTGILNAGAGPPDTTAVPRDPALQSLFLAVEFGDHPGVRAQLAGAADLAEATNERGESLIAAAAHAGEPELVELLAPHFPRRAVRRAHRTARRTAADVTSPERVRRFLLAAAGGRRATVERMLAAGMRPDAVELGGDGATALSLAVESGYLGVVVALLAAGADPNHRVDYETPVFRALDSACVDTRTQREMIRLLARAGADLEERDGDGLTPLMRATMDGAGNPEAIRDLVACGADPNAKHGAGVSALEIAEQHPGKEHLVALLVELGAHHGDAPERPADPVADLRGIGRRDVNEVVLAVRAPISSVSPSLHAQRAADLVVEGVQGHPELAVGDEGFLVYQLRGHAWTLVQSPLLDGRALHGGDAQALSRSFACPALLYEACTVTGRMRLRLYQDGAAREDWAPTVDALDRWLEELDCYVPGVGDDDLPGLAGRFRPEEFERVDWVGYASYSPEEGESAEVAAAAGA